MDYETDAGADLVTEILLKRCLPMVCAISAEGARTHVDS